MKPRVLFVDEDQERNGSTVSLEYLVKGFNGGGYEVFVLTWKVDPASKTRLMESATVIDARSRRVRSITLGVHFTYTRSPFSGRGMKMLLKDIVKVPLGIARVIGAIRRVKPDLVYANEYSVIQASIGASLCGIPAVMHIRSPLLTGTWGIRRRLLSRAILSCNRALFAITQRESDQLSMRGRMNRNIRVVGEFVPPHCRGQEGREACRSAFGFNGPGRVVAMLGGIRDIKGTLDFLRAAAILGEGGCDAEFVIAGNAHLDGTRERQEYYDRCMEVAETLKRRGHLRLLGSILNPMDLICASDIIVSPSTASHFSRPVVEAWRMAKPVVAARTPHMEELIENGVNGLIVERGDERGLARAIRTLLADDPLCRSLGEAGERKAAEEFDAERNVRTILGICASLLPGRGAAGTGTHGT